MIKKLRSYFLTGLVLSAPVAITLAVAWWFINKIDAIFTPFIPNQYLPENFLPFPIPGVGLIIGFIVITFFGFLARIVLGTGFIKFGESILNRTPVVRNIYKGLKQIFETVFSENGRSFSKAAIIEYPRNGVHAICFVSTDTKGEILKKIAKDGEVYLSVFLPTTPNPTSGFLLFLLEEDVQILDMSVEDAAKLVISAGLINPE